MQTEQGLKKNYTQEKSAFIFLASDVLHSSGTY